MARKYRLTIGARFASVVGVVTALAVAASQSAEGAPPCVPAQPETDR